MRGHKFLCLVDPTYFLEGEFTDAEAAQIEWHDDSRMEVLTLAHEKMEDNLVTLHTDIEGDEFEFVRDIEGKLWYVSDFWTKNQVIKAFEQTG